MPCLSDSSLTLASSSGLYSGLLGAAARLLTWMRSSPLKTSVPSGSTPLSGKSQRTDCPGLAAGGSAAAPQTPLKSAGACAPIIVPARTLTPAMTRRDLGMVFSLRLLFRLVVAEPELDAVAVGKCHLPHERKVGRVLRVITRDGDRLALTEVRAGDARAARRARAQARERPRGHFAGRVLHVQIDVHVGVHPLDLGDRALQRDRLVDVELSRK